MSIVYSECLYNVSGFDLNILHVDLVFTFGNRDAVDMEEVVFMALIVGGSKVCDLSYTFSSVYFPPHA